MAGKVLAAGLLLALFLTWPRPVPAGEVSLDHGAKTPERMTLCGEPVPLEDRLVYESLDQQLIIAAGNEDRVLVWLRLAGRYFPHIEKRLKEEGLPSDLKYAAVSRTSLRPDFQSRAGQAGLWSLNEGVARRYGLRLDKDMDERLDFERSTEAALKYFRDLYALFGQWALALAAFDCGEGCVAEAVKEQEERDFYRLFLPPATEQFVLRVAAVKEVMENPGLYGYAWDPKRAYPPLETDKVQVTLAEPVHLTRAARAVGLDYKTIKELNPGLLGDYLPQGSYILSVPAGLGGRMESFLK
ncbi:MAG: lytic transglycosylase domain-containing protein [Thermodesulfobacteriota bacterium]